MKFHDPISTEAGKRLIRLTAAEVFYTYALENRKRLGNRMNGRKTMKNTTDHSYESIRQALQTVVDNNGSVVLASEQFGVPKRTLYRYFERMRTGQPIRGVHSRRGTSALFRVDEHGQVKFEVIPNAENRKKSVTTDTFMGQLEKIDEKLSTIVESIERLETKLKELQME